MQPESRQRPRVLVACVGNIFLGDDAFGVEVARRLACRRLPDGVRVVDFGIRGLDLAYALLEGYQAVILVDAAPRGGTPGSLYVLEPELDCAPDVSEGEQLVETHNLDPARVLRLVAAMGGQIKNLIIVGCEPASADGDFMMEMSAPVKAAVDEAVLLVESLAARVVDVVNDTTTVMRQENSILEKEASTCHP